MRAGEAPGSTMAASEKRRFSWLPSIPGPLWLLYGNVVLYAACYMAQVPVLPYLTSSLGANMEEYGYVQTVVGIVQLFGGLVSGPLMDVYGPKLVLLLSYGTSAASYALTGMAHSMTLIYISRLPTLLQHAVMATRTAVGEGSSEADRARLLGYVGVAYGVGMAAGPIIGGYLAKHDLRLSAWVATAGSVFSLISILLFYRDPPKASAQPRAAAKGAEKKQVSLREIWRVATLPAVPSLLTVKLLTGMALAVFHSAFPLVVTTRFGLDAKGSGYVMSYSGLLGMFAQAVVVQWATARYDDRRIIAICIAGLSASFLGLMLASTTAHLCLVMVPFAVFGSLLSTVNTAQLTKAAPADMGTIVSLDMSVGSGVRVVSPTMATMALSRLGYPSVGGIGFVFMILLAVMVQLRVIDAAPSATARARGFDELGGKRS